jgi:hypothetical protein
MNNIIALPKHKPAIKNVLIDLTAVLLIYFMPALSHLINLPVYFIEPVRLMLILSIAHSSKTNTFILALSLPLFSHLVSAHPVFLKTVLISFELLLFSFLFYELSKRFKSVFTVMFVSIAAGKLFYYLFKYVLINFGLMQSELISTPLLMQLIITVIFSIYVSFSLNRSKPDIYKF